jgi:nucleoside-diphosphate-sugar epimerase
MYDAVKHARPDVKFYANSDAHRACPGFIDNLIPVEWVPGKRTRERTRVTLVEGDVTDGTALGRALDELGITNVVHLAALQVPFCKADPVAGAKVNVVGTVNVFEAAKRRAERMAPVVYTSSIAVFSAEDADPLTGRLTTAANPHPPNHYGVFKQANEGNARIYWLDSGLSSIGLRPMTVYGVGRDQGMTSGPTKAIVAVFNPSVMRGRIAERRTGG